MKKQLLLILYACILCTVLHAQSSWSVQHFGADYTLYGIDFLDENSGMAVGDSGVILRTMNGGQSWETMNSGVMLCLNSVGYIDADNIIVVGNDALILKSTDGGDSWNAEYLLGTMNGDLWSVDMSPSGKGIIVGQYQTTVTTTDGFSNKLIIRKNYTGGFFSTRILDEDNAFVFGLNGTLNPIVYKVAHFDSISTARFYYPYNGVIYSSGTLYDGYAFSKDSVLTVGHMVDNAASFGFSSYICRNQPWDTQYWDTEHIVYDSWYNGVDFVNNYGIAVGGMKDTDGIDQYIISESSDQGRNWKEVESPVKTCVLNDVKVLNATAYIVGDSGLIMKTKLPSVDSHTQQIDYHLNVYPNPSNGYSNISFLNPATGNVIISLYSAEGKLVNTVFKGTLPSGNHEFRILTQHLERGLYYCTLRTDEQVTTKKISIVN